MERVTRNLRKTRRFRQLGVDLSDRPAHHLSSQIVKPAGNPQVQNVRVGVTIVDDARCLSLICSFLQPHQARSAYHLGKQAQLDEQRVQHHSAHIGRPGWPAAPRPPFASSRFAHKRRNDEQPPLRGEVAWVHSLAHPRCNGGRATKCEMLRPESCGSFCHPADICQQKEPALKPAGFPQVCSSCNS